MAPFTQHFVAGHTGVARKKGMGGCGITSVIIEIDVLAKNNIRLSGLVGLGVLYRRIRAVPGNTTVSCIVAGHAQGTLADRLYGNSIRQQGYIILYAQRRGTAVTRLARDRLNLLLRQPQAFYVSFIRF